MVLGRKTRRWFGRPIRPAETTAEDFGRKFGRHHRAVVRPAESAGRTTSRLGSGGPAGRHHRRAEPPETNRPSRTTAEGTTGSFRPALGGGAGGP